MAKIRRAGFGTVFNIENEKVGIGTTGKFFTEVRVLKNLELSDANVVTQAQLENYQGFLSNETRLSGNDVDLNKLVGYVKGEAYYGESHAHTQDDGTVVNMVGSAHTSFSHNVIDASSNIQSGAMGDIIIDGEFTVSSGTTYCSSVDQLTCVDNFTVPTGTTDDRIHCHTAGSMRFNEDLGTLEFYTGDEWRTVNSFKDTGNRGRALIFGGSINYPAGTTTATIDFVNISSEGNALVFGDLTQSRNFTIGCGNQIRSLCMGGNTPETDIIDYVTPASEGDAIDFGNLQSSKFGGGGFSSTTRGFYCGGYDSPSDRDIIDYFEIHTLGNALDFGDLTRARRYMSGFASPIRGFNTGGSPSSDSRTIDVFTMSSKGNAVNFGDSTAGSAQFCGFSNPTRGIFLTDSPSRLTNLEYLNLSSEGNSILFGSLGRNTAAQPGSGSNQTRGIVAGGYANPSSTSTNHIDFIQILSLGDAQDFGDLAEIRALGGGTSDSHGGLGGF